MPGHATQATVSLDQSKKEFQKKRQIGYTHMNLFIFPLHLTIPITLGMGKGLKVTLELVNYRLESRPLTDPRPRCLGLDLDLTQNRARPRLDN